MKIGEMRWFINKHYNMPEQCKIVEHRPVGHFGNSKEYWIVDCAKSLSVRGLFAEELFKTQEEATGKLKTRFT